MQILAPCSQLPFGGNPIDHFGKYISFIRENGDIRYETVVPNSIATIPIEVKITIGLLNSKEILLVQWQDLTEIKQSQVEMIRAQKDAIEAGRFKGKLLDTLSYEIRNPLNAMNGLIEYLREEEERPESRQYLNELRSFSETVSSVINDILDYAKIDSRRIELQSHSYDLHVMLESTFSLSFDLRSKKFRS